jgi:hypothetical protein
LSETPYDGSSWRLPWSGHLSKLDRDDKRDNADFTLIKPVVSVNILVQQETGNGNA